MAYVRPRGSSIFNGTVLIFIGALLLLHNYRGYDLGDALGHWWPLILIIWGAIKLVERVAATRAGDPGAARVTAGEILLVLGLLALVGGVVAVDYGRQHLPELVPDIGNSYDYDVDVAPLTVPADARISIRGGRGDITVRTAQAAEIRVTGSATVRAWSQTDADRLAKPISAEIVKNGDGYDVHPIGYDLGDSRISVALDIIVPSKSSVTVRSDKGDITVSDLGTPVTISSGNGDVEVRDTSGDVSIDMRHGDAKVSDTKGNVKIAGKGGEVDVSNASGGLTLDGEFYGPIRVDKVMKGVRFISQRTDLTLTQLTGHLETGSGNLEIADAPGDLTLRTSSYDISIENAGGRVQVANRDGNVALRFSAAPKQEIEVTNSSAGISLSLPASSNFEIAADCHSCDIDSDFTADTLKKITKESGDSHLEGKYGSGRGPRITLKTSYGSITLRKTS